MSLPEQENPDTIFSSSLFEIGPGIYLTTSALKFTFSRSSGPGGQNVNKVSTKAELRVHLDSLAESDSISEAIFRRFKILAGNKITKSGELVITAQNHRNQINNKKECLLKLRKLLIQAKNIPPARRRTKPTRASVHARLEAKRRRASTKSNRRNPNIDPD